MSNSTSAVLREVLEANRRFAAGFGGTTGLVAAPTRRFAVLTCMDARLDPVKFAGLADGDAHVIRNAGGRASDDAIRSLIISARALGTREWFVIHHTGCGLQGCTNEQLADLLAESLEPDGMDASERKPGSDQGHLIDFLPFDDLDRSVVDDVARIRDHPLVSGRVPIYGYVYDVDTGLLREVAAASKIGEAAE